VRHLAIVHKGAPLHGAGAEWMLHEIFAAFVARGDTATVVFPGAPTYRLDGVVYTSSDRIDLAGLAREHSVVWTHLDNTRQAVALARETHRPLVHVVHNDRQLQFHEVRPADDVLVVPNSYWIDATIAPDYRRVVCRPPVPVARYQIRYEIPRDRVTLVNVTPAKGSRVFADIAKTMSDRRFLGVIGAYGIPDVRRLRKLRNVELVANTPDIVDVYARTRVLLMPSLYESWGRVAIEAACSGIPTIAARTPGLVESLGLAGIFANPQRVGQWVDELRRLDDPAEYAAASGRSRARADELAFVVAGDLVRLHRAVAELEAALPYDSPMPILDSVRAGLRCPICGAGSCACSPTPGDVLSKAVITRPQLSQPGDPTNVYRTWRGDFRYSVPRAQVEGLEPDGPDIPAKVRAVLGDDLAGAVERSYAGATDDARRVFLAELAVTKPRHLDADRVHELVTELDADPAPPPAPDPTDPDDDGRPSPDARVGDWLEWVGDDPARAAIALASETAGRGRSTLLAELEKRSTTPEA